MSGPVRLWRLRESAAMPAARILHVPAGISLPDSLYGVPRQLEQKEAAMDHDMRTALARLTRGRLA